MTSAGASPGPRLPGQPEAGETEAFDRDLARTRNLVRSIHERLYFRPLLDSLAGVGAMSPEAAAEALASFGFADAERTRAAVRELTRGLTRSSRMMRQLLPLVLDWLSNSPDPDLGLLGLRKLASASSGCWSWRTPSGTAPRWPGGCASCWARALLGEILVANPDLIPRLADSGQLQILHAQRWSTRPPARWRGGTTWGSASGRCAAGVTATCWASAPGTCSADRRDDGRP